jgi:putative ABC transport system substrate-binding protein
VEVAPKRLELLHELVPKSTELAFLMNPTPNPATESQAKILQAAASTFERRLRILRAGTESDLERAFAEMAKLRIGGVVISSADPFYTSQSERLAALSVRYAIPAAYQYREFVVAGGLASYGGSITDTYRLAGIYSGRILKGEKPADLPVQQGTKVELILNLKAAKSLGLTVPVPLLGRADEVIE